MQTQQIFSFLSALKDNNNKVWFDNHRKDYETAKKDFEQIVGYLITEINHFDDTIADLQAKNCIFRINRDIRFSADKTPYKINFGASIQKGGRKSNLGGYYIHLQPEGESFVAGGVYMPMPEDLQKIRQEIDYNSKEFHQIIENQDFVNHFKEIWGEKVKTSPKGYAKDHPDIELLKYKSYIAYRQFKDEEVSGKDFFSEVKAAFQAMKPLNDFLNRAIQV
jgi:uncharacterized protein (TIGR02453 family)